MVITDEVWNVRALTKIAFFKIKIICPRPSIFGNVSSFSAFVSGFYSKLGRKNDDILRFNNVAASQRYECSWKFYNVF